MTIKKATVQRKKKKILAPAPKRGFSRRDFSRRYLISQIVAIIIIVIEVSMLILRENERNNELSKYQTLQIFANIDDLAHEGMLDLRKRWTIYGSGIQQFEEIDNQYHATDDINEKFKMVEKMNNLFRAMDKYIHKVGALTTPEDISRDKEYHETEALLEPLLD